MSSLAQARVAKAAKHAKIQQDRVESARALERANKRNRENTARENQAAVDAELARRGDGGATLDPSIRREGAGTRLPNANSQPSPRQRHEPFLTKAVRNATQKLNTSADVQEWDESGYADDEVDADEVLSTTEAQVVHVQHQWSGSSSTARCTLRTLVSFCVAITASAVQLRDPTAVHPGKKYVPLRTRVHARFCFLPSNFGEFLCCHPYQRSAAARSHLQCTQGKSMSHHVPESMPDFVSSLRTSVSLCVAIPTNAMQLRDPTCNAPREQVFPCPQKTTEKIKSNLTTRHDQPFFERGKKSTSLQKQGMEITPTPKQLPLFE